MSSSLSVSAPSREKVSKKPLSKRIELSIGAFLFVSTSCICLFSLLFLSHSNRVATKGYELKRLQDTRSALMRENEVLSMQISDLQSLQAMVNDDVIKTMVKADRPQYIRVDTAVVLGEVNPEG